MMHCPCHWVLSFDCARIDDLPHKNNNNYHFSFRLSFNISSSSLCPWRLLFWTFFLLSLTLCFPPHLNSRAPHGITKAKKFFSAYLSLPYDRQIWVCCATVNKGICCFAFTNPPDIVVVFFFFSFFFPSLRRIPFVWHYLFITCIKLYLRYYVTISTQCLT